MNTKLVRLPLQVALALLLTVLSPVARSAQPRIVDRVVAVVGDQPILLSELQRRLSLAESGAPQSGTTIEPEARRRLLQQALEEIIDELLIAHEADARQVTITDDEVETALRSVAQSNGMPVEQLYEAAAKSGMDRGAYRLELGRTLREQKLLQLELSSKVQVEASDIRDAYDRLVADKRRLRPYHPAWIVVRIPRDASADLVNERRARADEIVRKARAGASFVELARQYSDDPVTNKKGGDLGERVPRGPQQGMTLRPKLEEQAMRLRVGETSAPLRIENSFVVIHLLDRPRVEVPSYESSQEYLRQQVYAEKFAAAGMVEAKVGEPEVRYSDDGSRVTIHVPVEEGPVYRIGEISFGGEMAANQVRYRAALDFAPGDVFDRSKVMAAIERLNALRAARGLADTVTPQTELHPEKQTLDLTFRPEK